MTESRSRAELIRRRAAALRKELHGGLLYGQRIDVDDPDQALIAAYSLGLSVGREEREHSPAAAIIVPLNQE